MTRQASASPVPRRSWIARATIAGGLLVTGATTLVLWLTSSDSAAASEPVAAPAVARPDPPTPPSPKPSDRFVALVGRWLGTGHQPDVGMDWDAVLTIDNPGPVGSRIGTVEYPSLRCRGELTREPDEADQYVIHEHISVDPDHHCVPEGTLKILLTDDHLEVTWYYAHGGEAARGVLAH